MLGLGISRMQAQAYTETGAGAASLAVGEQDLDSVTSHLGVRLAYLPSANSPVTIDASVAWAHEFADVNPRATLGFAAAPETTFVVSGIELERETLQAGVRVSGQAWRNLSLYAEGKGAWQSGASQLAATAGLQWLW